MESYKDFAHVYDMFMDNVGYESWRDFIIRRLREYHIEDGLVLDLGCGTGTMTELLASEGYDMIGVDNAEDMLMEAMEKRSRSGLDILYLLQDMEDFELYGTVRAVVSVCDSLNYIIEEEELKTVFSLVNNYLDPGGIFIFDMNMPYKYREVIGDRTIAENRPESSFIWENEYDPETNINTYALTLFMEREDGLYEKEEELHIQKAYEKEDIIRLLKEAGLRFVAVYDDYRDEPPGEKSERVCFVAMEQGKQRS